MLGGIGDSVRKQIEEYFGSREAAEQLQKAVGADQRLKQVRNGMFEEDGVIGSSFLPSGMSPNLLPARWAEYEGYIPDSSIGYATGGEANSWVEPMYGFNALVTDPAGANPGTLHFPYLDKISDNWYQVVDGQSYIYSTTAIRPPWDVGNAPTYVGLRVQAADDAAGTNNVNVFLTASTQTDMTKVDDTNKQARIYAKFTVPAGKPYIRVHHKVLYNAIDYPYTAWNWNMLELVNSYRSFPSKYAAPTPRAGELAPQQFAFGQGANVLPYSKGSLAVFEALNVTLNSEVQGDVIGTRNGLGYYFLTYTDNAWYAPTSNMGPNAGFSADRMKPGKVYMASVYITNLRTTGNLAVQMRVGTGDSASDIVGKTGTWQVKGTGTESTIAPGESKRISVKWTHDAIASSSTTGAIGPRIEIKSRQPAGGATGKFCRVDNFMAEEVDADDIYPSKYSLPAVGRNELAYNQIELQSAVQAKSTVSQNVANGATATVVVSTLEYDYNFGGTNDLTTNNFLTVYKKGIYIISANVEWTLSGVDGNNRLILLVRLQSNGVNTDYQVGSQIAPAISGQGNINSNIIMPLYGKESNLQHTVFLRATNTSESALRTIIKARLSLTYLGDNDQ